MFRQLADIGITPEWNIKTSDLRELVTRNNLDMSRNVTAPVTQNVTAKTRRDETGRDNIVPLANANGDAARNSTDPDAMFWANAKAYLGAAKGSLIGKWSRDYGKEATAQAITSAQLTRAVDPVSYIERTLRKPKPDDDECRFTGPC